jgi:hypothetical protein
LVQTKCAKNHQIEDTDAASLQRQRVGRTALAQFPTEQKQGNSADGDTEQPELDRNVRVLVGVPQ